MNILDGIDEEIKQAFKPCVDCLRAKACWKDLALLVVLHNKDAKDTVKYLRKNCGASVPEEQERVFTLSELEGTLGVFKAYHADRSDKYLQGATALFADIKELF